MVGTGGKFSLLVAWLHSTMSEALTKFWLVSLSVSCFEGPWVRQQLAVGGRVP